MGPNKAESAMKKTADWNFTPDLFLAQFNGKQQELLKRMILEEDVSLEEFLKTFIEPDRLNQILFENSVGSTTYKSLTHAYEKLINPKAKAHIKLSQLKRSLSSWDLAYCFPFKDWEKELIRFHVLCLFLEDRPWLDPS